MGFRILYLNLDKVSTNVFTRNLFLWLLGVFFNDESVNQH